MDKSKSRIAKIVYGILAFMLSFCLFLFSFCSIAEVTFMNKSYILDNMNSSNYYEELEHELTESLTDLGYASGLDDKFFDELLDQVFLREEVESYIDSFYTGKSSVVDTTKFKQLFNEALDEYIAKNNITQDQVSAEGREYLIKEAARTYTNCIKMPLFTSIANYFYKLQGPLLIITIGLGVFALALCAVIFFTNYWKHRSLRYLCYGFSGGFLSVVIIPIVVFASGMIQKVNFEQRSMYNLFVSLMNNFFTGFFIIAAIFLLISIFLFILYRGEYKKANSND